MQGPLLWMSPFALLFLEPTLATNPLPERGRSTVEPTGGGGRRRRVCEAKPWEGGRGCPCWRNYVQL